MTPETTKTLIEMLKVGVDSVNAFWSLYSAVAFALLGYVFAAQRPIQLFKVRIVLAVVFGVFALSNWYSLIREQHKAVKVCEYVIAEFRKDPAMQAFAESLQKNAPTSASAVTSFHIFIDLSVISMIFLAPTITQRKDGSDENSTQATKGGLTTSRRA
jgi:hypothetical protein